MTTKTETKTNKHGIKPGHPVHNLATAIHKHFADHHAKTGELPDVDSVIDTICGEGSIFGSDLAGTEEAVN